MVKEELCAKEFLEYMRVWKTEMRELSDELSYWKSMSGSSEDGELAFAVADREAYLGDQGAYAFSGKDDR